MTNTDSNNDEQEEKPVEFYKDKDLFGLEKPAVNPEQEKKVFPKTKNKDTENQVIAEPVNQENFPPLVKRFQSLIVDQVFIILCMVIFSQLLANTDEESTGPLRGFLLFGLFFLYEPCCMAFGCTMGNYISGIRVRRFRNQEKRINIFQSYLRFIVKLLLGIISFFTVTSNKYKRAIHDMSAGTIMIYAK
jgi:uncharacterized RDD family membrane protein YckC